LHQIDFFRHFNVNTIANITKCDGRTIKEAYFKRGKVLEYMSKSMLQWPIQRRPALDTLSIWKNTIQTIANCDGTGIIENLGSWCKNPFNYMKYNAAIHREKGHILLRNTTTVRTRYNAVRNYGSRIFYMRQILTTLPKSISDLYIPLDEMKHGEMISCNVRSLPICNEIDQNITTQNDYDKVLGYFRTTKWYKEIVRHTNRTFSGKSVSTMLESNEYIIGSDGGLRRSIAGVGIVTTTRNTTILTNSLRIQTSYNDMTSYRCEAIGILGALYTYINIQEVRKRLGHDTSLGILNILCDNEGVIKVINKMKRTKPTTKLYYSSASDIIVEILNLHIEKDIKIAVDRHYHTTLSST
jgi:hypothetical protein